MTRLGLSAALTAVLTVTLAAWEPAPARAQTAEPAFEQVEPGFKGVIGLGLVGAEVGFIIPAVAGLHETWAFIVFPVVGAAGGALGGYFALEQPGNTELSVAALAFGMAMVIPSMVITLVATAYDPEDGDAVEAEGGFDGEFEESLEIDAGGGTEVDVEPSEAAAPRSRRLARAGGGLLRWTDDVGLMLGVPGIAINAAYSETELARYGGQQQTELHVPVVTGAF